MESKKASIPISSFDTKSHNNPKGEIMFAKIKATMIKVLLFLPVFSFLVAMFILTHSQSVLADGSTKGR